MFFKYAIIFIALISNIFITSSVYLSIYLVIFITGDTLAGAATKYLSLKDLPKIKA